MLMQNSTLKKSWWTLAFFGVLTLFFVFCDGLMTIEIIRAIQSNTEISSASWARAILYTVFTFYWCAFLLISFLPDFTINFTEEGMSKLYKGKRRVYMWSEITRFTVHGDRQIKLEAPHWKVSINQRIFSSSDELIREVEKHIPPEAAKQSFPNKWWDFLSTFSYLFVMLFIMLIQHIFPQSRPFTRELMYEDTSTSK